MKVKIKKYVIPGCLGLTLLGNCSYENIKHLDDEILNNKINNVMEDLSRKEMIKPFNEEIIFSDNNKHSLNLKAVRSTAYFEPLIINIMPVSTLKENHLVLNYYNKNN